MTSAVAEAPITFVLPEAERYGATGGAIATVTHELVAELLRSGVGAVVISPRLNGHPYQEGEVVTLKRTGDTATWAHRFGRRAAARLSPSRLGPRARYLAELHRRLAQRESTRVVVNNDPTLAAELSLDARRTVVLWLHNYLQGAEAEALARVPATVRMIAVSESVRRWTIDQVGVNADQVVTILNAVNHEHFHAVEHAPGTTAGLQLVCHGRVDPNKGQLLAVRAVALARARGAGDVRLTVLGGALSFGHPGGAQQRYEAELQEAADKTGAVLTGRVPADEMGARLRDFDVALVLPLVPEPFGLVAVEAMASGCAVIAVPTGGLAEVLGDAALLVQPDVDAVAEAIVRVASDAELLQILRERGAARAQSFSWAGAAAALIELIRSDERNALGDTKATR